MCDVYRTICLYLAYFALLCAFPSDRGSCKLQQARQRSLSSRKHGSRGGMQHFQRRTETLLHEGMRLR